MRSSLEYFVIEMNGVTYLRKHISDKVDQVERSDKNARKVASEAIVITSMMDYFFLYFVVHYIPTYG